MRVDWVLPHRQTVIQIMLSSKPVYANRLIVIFKFIANLQVRNSSYLLEDILIRGFVSVQHPKFSKIFQLSQPQYIKQPYVHQITINFLKNNIFFKFLYLHISHRSIKTYNPKFLKKMLPLPLNTLFITTFSFWHVFYVVFSMSSYKKITKFCSNSDRRKLFRPVYVAVSYWLLTLLFTELPLLITDEVIL